MKNTYIVSNYQSKKPFSNFLSAIAGKMGVPMWAFYVNRGQLISSFGSKDKNGSIIEFFPANGAYLHTNTMGFRSFVKIDGKVYEFFNEANENQILEIRPDQVIIKELNKELELEYIVKYHTLPNESNGGLVRSVKINNLGESRKIEVIDGLPQILPAGIDYGGYKAISNLLQSWMEVEELDESLFFKLRASTNDTSEISSISDGNYYVSYGNNIDINYIYDSKVIFKENTSLIKPISFIESKDNLLSQEQIKVNQVPSAFSYIDMTIDKEISFISLMGYSNNKDNLLELLSNFNYEYLSNKELENRLLHDELTNVIDTKTSCPLFDQYLKQNLLDNVLRGGFPLVYDTLDGTRGYHIYSRKHGDLERDYNFFSIEPKYYSQGNGNFRDVLQNRRNDLLFVPSLKDSNLLQFASLIQADGYNPLSIEGMKFIYKGNKKYHTLVDEIISSEFTPGDLATVLKVLDFDVDETMVEIIKDSKQVIKASFGEGYWQDHFTYLDDVIDSIESIYPDELEEIVFKKHDYLFYNSNVYVRPRHEKYVKNSNNRIRQVNAIKHLESDLGNWLLDSNNKEVKVNLMGKLITLIANKYALLDPMKIGISYEADKPGWNDAMNGLPALFASGVGETIELLKLTKRVHRYLNTYSNNEVTILNDTEKFISNLHDINELDDHLNWDYRMNTVEKYRLDLLENKNKVLVKNASDFIKFVECVIYHLENALTKAKELNEIIPTYLTYEVAEYEDIGTDQFKVKKFNLKPVPVFLEAPARYFKYSDDLTEKKSLYKTIKNSEMYDKKFKFYKTSIDLTNESLEIGRIHAFTKGWFERESNFLHMTYKYILSLIKSNMYDEFYEEIKSNFTCFMDPNVYGRSPFENSSFIAPSNNPDYKKQGQGFVARLSGSTAEMISIWNQMFFGDKLFTYVDNKLTFAPSPKLSKNYFENNIVTTTLFSNIKYKVTNLDNINTYDSDAVISKIVVTDSGLKEHVFLDGKVSGLVALQIRNSEVKQIELIISKEEKK